MRLFFFFFFQAEDGIRDADVTGVQTCALPIYHRGTPCTCCNSPLPISSVRWTRTSSTGRRKARPGTPPGDGRGSTSPRICGAYTPAFHLMYDLLPDVALYRRPADATFVLAALIAVIAGYLVHRWLTGTVPPATRLQRAFEIASPIVLIAGALALAASVVGVRPALVPVVTAVVFTAAAVAVLALARRLDACWPVGAVALIAAFMALDLAWNNAPHVSTALPPARFDALRANTDNETVRLLKTRLAGAAAPDRRDRVELIGIDYHWPNLSLAQGFDHVFGHNPLRLRWFQDATHAGDTVAIPSQRVFSPLYPSYRSAFADLLGVRFIATGVPVEQIDSSLKPGDLNFIARTKDAYVYENPRALPRVMLLTDWRLANFDELLRAGWPSVDPRRTVLLK